MLIYFQLQSNNTNPKCNIQIEKLLNNYPNERLKNLEWDSGDETEAAETILEDATNIYDKEKRTNARKKLSTAMRQIRGHKKLCLEVYFNYEHLII